MMTLHSQQKEKGKHTGSAFSRNPLHLYCKPFILLHTYDIHLERRQLCAALPF